MLPSIRFYHLTTTSLEKALPKLLEKIYAQKQRALLLTDSEEQTEALALQLWTYNPASFLPHGTHKDGFIQDHPIFITHREENPNKAEILIILNESLPAFISSFKECLDLFEAPFPDENSRFLKRWTHYAAQNYALIHWKQQKDGQWEKIQESTP